MNTNHKPTTTALLTIGESVFIVPPSKLETAFKLMEFLSTLPAHKDEYLGHFEDLPDARYGLVPTQKIELGLEFKPRLILTVEEYQELQSRQNERIAARAAAKAQEGKK